MSSVSCLGQELAGHHGVGGGAETGCGWCEHHHLRLCGAGGLRQHRHQTQRPSPPTEPGSHLTPTAPQGHRNQSHDTTMEFRNHMTINIITDLPSFSKLLAPFIKMSECNFFSYVENFFLSLIYFCWFQNHQCNK